MSEPERALGFYKSAGFYTLETLLGEVVTYLHDGDGEDKHLSISSVSVDPAARGCGHGSWLVRQAVTLAEELGANSIKAHIVSREGYEVTRSVFGIDYIEVESLGEFGQYENDIRLIDIGLQPTSTPTMAILNYPISPSITK